MTAQQIAAAAAVAGVIVAVLARWPGRFIWRLLRGIWAFLEDWKGETERPGVPARPGVMERLWNVEQAQAQMGADIAEVKEQLGPNGGTSVFDKVSRIDEHLQSQPQATAIHIHPAKE